MAITLTGTGGLFTRLGKIFAYMRNINGFRGETPPAAAGTWGASGPAIKCVKTAVDDIFAQYLSTLPFIVDGLQSSRTSYISSVGGELAKLRSMAEQTIIEMAHADAVLTSKDITTALAELIRQLKASTDSILKNTVSVSVAAAAGNTGTTTVIASVLGPDGLSREGAYAEVLEAKIGTDSQAGATAGSESIDIKGEVSQGDRLHYLWPAGSGSGTSVTIADPVLEAGTNNYLTNSDFETFTVANTPDKWPIILGTPGTSILKSTSPYRGTNCLQFVGDGAELTGVAQTFNSSAGTTATLKPNTVYAFSCFLKVSAVPSAGALAFGIIDGSNAVVNDDAGTANTSTKDLTAATTSYVAFSGFFRTPKLLPTTAKFAPRLTTALETGKSVFIDSLAFAAAREAYPGGPYVAAFRSAIDPIKNDQWNITVANNFAGIFQSMTWRCFSTLLPSAASPTIPENLVA